MKYGKTLSESDISGLGMQTLSYRLVGVFPVDNSYFDLSENNATAGAVNTEELVGYPNCPCCGNQFGFAMCTCGKIHCVGDKAEGTCPWCGVHGKYGVSKEGFNVNRTQG